MGERRFPQGEKQIPLFAWAARQGDGLCTQGDFKISLYAGTIPLGDFKISLGKMRFPQGKMPGHCRSAEEKAGRDFGVLEAWSSFDGGRLLPLA